MNFILPLKEICVQWDQDRSVYLDISFILNHAKCFPNCGVNNLAVIHLSQPGLGLTPLWLCKAYIEVFRWPWWLRQSSAPSPEPHPPLIICMVTQWSRPAHWPCWKLSRGKKNYCLFWLKWTYKPPCLKNGRNTRKAALGLETASRQPLFYAFPFCHPFFLSQHLKSHRGFAILPGSL